MLGALLAIAGEGFKATGQLLQAGSNGNDIFGIAGRALEGAGEKLQSLNVEGSEVAGVAAPSVGIADRARSFFGLGQDAPQLPQLAEKVGRSSIHHQPELGGRSETLAIGVQEVSMANLGDMELSANLPNLKGVTQSIGMHA